MVSGASRLDMVSRWARGHWPTSTPCMSGGVTDLFANMPPTMCSPIQMHPSSEIWNLTPNFAEYGPPFGQPLWQSTPCDPVFSRTAAMIGCGRLRKYSSPYYDASLSDPVSVDTPRSTPLDPPPLQTHTRVSSSIFIYTGTQISVLH